MHLIPPDESENVSHIAKFFPIEPLHFVDDVVGPIKFLQRQRSGSLIKCKLQIIHCKDLPKLASERCIAPFLRPVFTAVLSAPIAFIL